MTHIKNRISRAINPADIDKKWCRSMNDQFDLEQGWKNELLKDLYTTQAHAAVIHKRIVPRPDSDDIAFGLQHSEYESHDDKII